MRMRKKKHLRERLDKINSYFLVIERDVSNVKKAIEDKKIIDLESAFGNNNPVEIDIGCGKGAFVTALSKNHKDVNYIAVEMMENIILLAGEKAEKEKLTNLKYINTGAEYLPRYLKEKSISKIYLNFSPPYPQKSYSNRRLTNMRYLEVYSKLLTDDGVIYQKTDDKSFFDYSVDNYIKCGYFVEILTSDSADEYVKIITEYENKFIKLGMPIYALKATRKTQN